MDHEWFDIHSMFLRPKVVTAVFSELGPQFVQTFVIIPMASFGQAFVLRMFLRNLDGDRQSIQERSERPEPQFLSWQPWKLHSLLARTLQIKYGTPACTGSA